MGNGPPGKRLRLALEDATSIPPPVSGEPIAASAAAAVPYDVTEKGYLIYQPAPTEQSRLSEQIMKLWAQHPNLQGLDDATGEEMEVKGEDGTKIEPESGAEASATETPAPEGASPGCPTALRSVGDMRQYLHEQLFHAHSEIGVALDVVNVLLAGLKPATSIVAPANDPLAVLNANKGGSNAAGGVPPPPIPLPANSISYTYTNQTKTEPPVLIYKTKLGLGAKCKQLKTASEILLARAEALESVIYEEHSFWEQALALRHKNWIIQTRRTESGQPHAGGSGRSSFYVLYGYRTVGSTYGDQGVADLLRIHQGTKATSSDDQVAQEKATEIRLRFDRRAARYLRVALVDTRTGAILGTSRDATHHDSPPVSDLAHQHAQLLVAQRGLFDAELYQRLLREAKALRINDSLAEAHEVVSLPWPGRQLGDITGDETAQQQHWALTFELVKDDPGTDGAAPPPPPSDRELNRLGLIGNPNFTKVALDLALCRQYRFNRHRAVERNRLALRGQLRSEQINLSVPPADMLLPSLLAGLGSWHTFRAALDVLAVVGRDCKRAGQPAALAFTPLTPLPRDGAYLSGAAGGTIMQRDRLAQWSDLERQVARHTNGKVTAPHWTAAMLAHLCTQPTYPFRTHNTDSQELRLAWTAVADRSPLRPVQRYLAVLTTDRQYFIWVYEPGRIDVLPASHTEGSAPPPIVSFHRLQEFHNWLRCETQVDSA